MNKNRIYLSIIILFTACIITACNQNSSSETSHEGEEQKEAIEEKATFEEEIAYQHEDGSYCHAQSPINILSFNVDVQGKHNITLNFKDEINAVENLGHTVQLDFKQGSTLTVDGETFEFKQLHFHTPSEHLIDGIKYPMEMHIVNTLKDQGEDEETQYLVIGVLFKMGAESKFINEFINSIPDEAHEVKEVQTKEILVSDLFAEHPEDIIKNYYHYMGSLTTPPYSESVRWYVSKDIFQASPAQIKRILDIEGVNARQVQSLNGRALDEF